MWGVGKQRGTKKGATRQGARLSEMTVVVVYAGRRGGARAARRGGGGETGGRGFLCGFFWGLFCGNFGDFRHVRSSNAAVTHGGDRDQMLTD